MLQRFSLVVHPPNLLLHEYWNIFVLLSRMEVDKHFLPFPHKFSEKQKRHRIEVRVMTWHVGCLYTLIFFSLTKTRRWKMPNIRVTSQQPFFFSARSPYVLLLSNPQKYERSINFKRNSVSEDLAVFLSNSARCKHQGYFFLSLNLAKLSLHQHEGWFFIKSSSVVCCRRRCQL